MVKMVLGVGLEPSSGRGVHPGIPPWVNNSDPLLNSADMNRGWGYLHHVCVELSIVQSYTLFLTDYVEKQD
jgi:hypothetical protein